MFIQVLREHELSETPKEGTTEGGLRASPKVHEVSGTEINRLV